jgi:PAS domain S-box-containing protein
MAEHPKTSSAEHTRWESEQRFRKIFEEGPLGMAFTALNYKIIKVNQTLCRMLGYAEAEMTALTFLDITHPDHKTIDQAQVQKLVKGEIALYKTDKRYLKKDGAVMWGALTVSLIRDENGQPLYFLSMIEDISERKAAEASLKKAHAELEQRVQERTRELSEANRKLQQEIEERRVAEAALLESEWKLELFFSQSLDGFFFMMIDEPVRWDDSVNKDEVLDYVFAHQRITKVNDAMLAQYGATREQFLGLTPNDLFAHDLAHGREVWRKFFDEGRLHVETYERKLDGTPMWIEGDYICFYDGGGRILGHFGIQRDVTERKHAEAALRKAHDELEQRVKERTAELLEANTQLKKEITERKRTAAALKESEERLSRILESAMDAIITVNQQRDVVLFNTAAEKVFLCSASDAIGKPLDRYLSPAFQNLLSTYIKESARRNPARSQRWAPEGLTAIRANGDAFPIEATLSQVEVSGEKLFTIILRDINERQKAEAELSKLQLENVYLQEEIKSEHNFGELIGASLAMKVVFDNIKKVAATDATVLVTGETGTGKELIARAIHKESSRKNSALIKVNCAALPAGLIESELFGHEKGAFTGALARKKGRFELADGGTIFLDEVGELPLETQVKLLRVLQEQEFERVGGTLTVKVNVRVIAATNRNLQEAVQQGGFRADLYYRLNIFPIHVPALRERLEDVPLLANYLIQQFCRRLGKRVDGVQPQALEKLQRYHWPGNVRELANVLERAVILCDGRQLQPQHIGITFQPTEVDINFRTLEEAERQHILRALEKTGGVLSGPNGAARLLGMNRSTLWSRMRKLGIDPNTPALQKNLHKPNVALGAVKNQN